LSRVEGNPEADNAHVLQAISKIPEEPSSVETNSDTSPKAHCNSIKPVIKESKTASGLGGSELPQKPATPSPIPDPSKATAGN